MISASARGGMPKKLAQGVNMAEQKIDAGKSAERSACRLWSSSKSDSRCRSKVFGKN